jgi:ubiquinone/menaquinone biosynthesis C-methylase UbiE
MASTTQFTGTIPTVYDEALGPLLFGWSANELGARVSVPAGGRVLEIACGTGISTLGLRAALPPTVDIVATDLNPDMLAVAQNRQPPMAGVSYCTVDAQYLPFDNATFDSVVCQFGLMFFPEQVRALEEAVRVLKPHGQLLYSVWGSLAVKPPADVVNDTLARLFREEPLAFRHTPFSMHNTADLRALFEEAGATDISIEACDHTATVPSAQQAAHGFVCGTPGLLEIESRPGVVVEDVIREVGDALAQAFGGAPMVAPLRALFIDARG